MSYPQKHIEDLENQASERELVALLAPERGTRLRNELRATELRNRVATLTELRNRVATLKVRLAKVKRDHPEK